MLEENKLQHLIIEKIRRGEVVKRPRLYFVAQSVLLALAAVLALLLSIAVLSFIAFSLHESGEVFLLGFGRRGIFTLAALFPWLLLGLALIFLLLLEWLLRRFRAGYRLSILRIFTLLALGVFIGSMVLSLTPLHAFLLDQADHDALPVIGPVYERIHDSNEAHGIWRGRVGALATSTFTLVHDDSDRDTDDGTWVVLPPQGFAMSQVPLGERMYIAGSLVGDHTIQAYGIRKF